MTWKVSRESLAAALGQIESWTKTALVFVGATGVVLGLNNLLDFKKRIAAWIVLATLCAICALQPRTQRPIGFVPAPVDDGPVRDVRWWWGVTAALLALGIDLVLHFSLEKPIAHVRGAVIAMGDLPADEPSSFGPENPATRGKPVVVAQGIEADTPAVDAITDCTDWLTAPREKWVDLVRTRAEIYVDNFDTNGPMSEGRAQQLYRNHLGENFGFQIRKAADQREVFVEDVEIIVHKFISCIPETRERGTARHCDIIVVELERRSCDTLPWTFGAKYLLDDPQGQVVIPWSRVSVSLRDEFERSFLVKVGAKDAGIYVYTANLILRGDSGKLTVPLVTSPRSVFFREGRNVTSGQVHAFWEEVRKSVPRGNGFGAPAPAAPPQSIPAPTRAPDDDKAPPAAPPPALKKTTLLNIRARLPLMT